MFLFKRQLSDTCRQNLKNASVTGGHPGANEVLEFDTKLKTWDKVGTMEQYRAYSAASVVNTLDVLNICIN